MSKIMIGDVVGVGEEVVVAAEEGGGRCSRIEMSLIVRLSEGEVVAEMGAKDGCWWDELDPEALFLRLVRGPAPPNDSTLLQTPSSFSTFNSSSPPGSSPPLGLVQN